MLGDGTETLDRSLSSTSNLLPSIAAEELMSAFTIVPSTIFAEVTELEASLASVTAPLVISEVPMAPLDAEVILPCASTVMSAAL